MSVLRTPDERFADLPGFPFAAHHLEVEGMRLARVDEGQHDAEPVLLLHGEPTWSYLYRGVIPHLVAAGLRAVAPDYAGFGRSDKPVDTEWYSYDAHVTQLTQVVDRLSLSHVTVVVQDWGGPIGLRWAMENPERVARIVILNTGLFSGRAISAGLAGWLEYAGAQIDLDVGGVVSAACGGLPDDVAAAYDAPFPTVAHKAGPLTFPRLVPTAADAPGAAAQLRVRESLDAWEGPVQVAFSDGDPIFPVGVGEAWSGRLRNADPFVVVKDAGHFLQEQQPRVVADLITAFIARHPR